MITQYLNYASNTINKTVSRKRNALAPVISSSHSSGVIAMVYNEIENYDRSVAGQLELMKNFMHTF